MLAPRSRRGPPATSVAAAGQQDRRGLRGRPGEVERAPAGERGEDRERQHRGRQQLGPVAAQDLREPFVDAVWVAARPPAGSAGPDGRRDLAVGGSAGRVGRPSTTIRPSRASRTLRLAAATAGASPSGVPAPARPAAAPRGFRRRHDPLGRRPVDPARRPARRPAPAAARRSAGSGARRGRAARPRASPRRRRPSRPRLERDPARAARPSPPSVTTRAAASSGERRIQPRRSGMLRVPNRSSVTADQASSAVFDAASDDDPRPAGPQAAGSSAAIASSSRPGVGDHQVARRVPQVVVDERRRAPPRRASRSASSTRTGRSPSSGSASGATSRSTIASATTVIGTAIHASSSGSVSGGHEVGEPRHPEVERQHPPARGHDERDRRRVTSPIAGAATTAGRPGRRPPPARARPR